MFGFMLGLALLMTDVPTTDHRVDVPHYGTQTESVILRNWTPPEVREFASDNTVTPAYVASVATILLMKQPARIGRVERCIYG